MLGIVQSAVIFTPHSDVRHLDPHFQMENLDNSCQHPAPTLWWFCALKCAACAGDPHPPELKAGDSVFGIWAEDSGTSHTPCYSLETFYHFGSVLWKQILNSGYTLKSYLLKKIFAGYLSTGKLCLIRPKSMATGQPSLWAGHNCETPFCGRDSLSVVLSGVF